jgi:hypothetical protein
VNSGNNATNSLFRRRRRRRRRRHHHHRFQCQFLLPELLESDTIENNTFTPLPR